MPIDRWNQKAVVDAVAADVEASMETAVKVVEVDARRRLLSIGDPDWGAGYRRLIALYRLTSFVQREGLAIVGAIGVPPDPRSGTRMMGFYIETGSRTARAHPWLRPALLTNLRNIIGLLGGR
jgi:hypothetical protein